MNEWLAVTSPAVGLAFLLGLRHGLDPDHIAVINTLTLRGAADSRRWAPWTGSFFAVGHSLSVLLVAVAVSWLAREVIWPDWLPSAIDSIVVLVLIAVGAVNLRQLFDTQAEQAQTGRIERWIRNAPASGPLTVVGIGAVFGMVMGTSSQAAAWGLAGSGTVGVLGGLQLALAFGTGMVLVDTLDSQLLMRFHRESVGRARSRLYYCGVRWLIVVMSFGMAAYTAMGLIADVELPDTALTGVGLVGAIGVLLLLFQARRTAIPAEVAGLSSARETP